MALQLSFMIMRKVQSHSHLITVFGRMMGSMLLRKVTTSPRITGMPIKSKYTMHWVNKYWITLGKAITAVCSHMVRQEVENHILW